MCGGLWKKMSQSSQRVKETSQDRILNMNYDYWELMIDAATQIVESLQPEIEMFGRAEDQLS
jgi:hypothetical protein